ncbi:MAG: hypothetical protein ACFFFT_13140 [Candidatus Thorarchaeota archaeon]
MKKKILPLFILSFLVLAIIGTVSAWPSYIIEWQETDHGSCHGGTYTESVTGVMTATVDPSNATVDPGEQFTVTLSITSFAEAANHVIYVGISAKLGDNDDFFYGVQNISGEFHLESYNTTLDGSGNSPAPITIVVYAPVKGGKYTLSIVALDGGEGGYGTWKPFDYIKTDITITVPGGGNGAEIPGYNILIISAVGLLTLVPIAILILHKRKKRGDA